MIQAVTKQVFEEYDDDRRRLARQLHNTAAQQLAAMQINFSLIPAAQLPPRAAQALADCIQLAQSCGSEIRSATQRLYPPLLEEAGLAAAVRALAMEAGVKLLPDLPDDFGTLPPHLSIAAFRIAEELVLGCEDPSRATLGLELDPNWLTISVAGAGAIRASVRERAKSLDAKFSLWETGSWRTVIYRLPLTAEES